MASMLMDEVLRSLDKTKEISVSTFRADALIEELNYPNQKFVLYPAGAGKLPSIT